MLLTVPAADGVKVTCTSALTPGARVPRLHMTSRPEIVHAPWLDVAVPAAPSDDRLCVSVTCVAAVAAAFVTVDE